MAKITIDLDAIKDKDSALVVLKEVAEHCTKLEIGVVFLATDDEMYTIRSNLNPLQIHALLASAVYERSKVMLEHASLQKQGDSNDKAH